MTAKTKMAARIKGKPSTNPRNPRKGKKAKGKGKGKAKAKALVTARSRRIVELAPVADEQGRAHMAERVVDTIDLLYRRRHIDGDQRLAADIYREAWALCGGSIPSPLDTSRVRGSGIATPGDAQLIAARRLAAAGALLGKRDQHIMVKVVCEGCTIEETADDMFGVSCSARGRRENARHLGYRLRLALELLVDYWLDGKDRRGGKGVMRAQRASDASGDVTATATGPRQVQRGRAVHATSKRTFEI